MIETTRAQEARVEQIACFHPRLTVELPRWPGGPIRVRCLTPTGLRRVVRELVIDALGRTLEESQAA